MTLERLRELMSEQVNAGFRELNEIPLMARGAIYEAAFGAFDEAFAAAKGKPADSPEMRTLQTVSRLIVGDWGDKK